MTVRFEVETLIDAPIGRVFDLSLDIDAHRASMSASNELRCRRRHDRPHRVR